jgi:hypothetical protein
MADDKTPPKTAPAPAPKPAAQRMPIYRERGPELHFLSPDDPSLLVGCMCGYTIPPEVADGLARVNLFGSHKC